MGGVFKRVIHYDPALRTYAECLMACYLIAFQEALAAYTVTAELPANPLIELDDQVGLIDAATGINSRVWIVSREQTMTTTAGETTWRMSIGGSLLDTSDMANLIAASDAVTWGALPPPTANGTRTARKR
jgi:hypothetical protein